MSAKIYSTLVACLFSLMAVAQLVRAFQQVPLMVGDVAIPVVASWVACGVLALLAILGFTAKRG